MIFGLMEAATLFRLAAGGWNHATAAGKGKQHENLEWRTHGYYSIVGYNYWVMTFALCDGLGFLSI